MTGVVEYMLITFVECVAGGIIQGRGEEMNKVGGGGGEKRVNGRGVEVCVGGVLTGRKDKAVGRKLRRCCVSPGRVGGWGRWEGGREGEGEERQVCTEVKGCT